MSCGLNKMYLFFKERFYLKINKTTLFTKYIHICTSHHQLHIQTLYIIPNVVFTMVKKAFIILVSYLINKVYVAYICYMIYC